MKILTELIYFVVLVWYLLGSPQVQGTRAPITFWDCIFIVVLSVGALGVAGILGHWTWWGIEKIFPNEQGPQEQ